MTLQYAYLFVLLIALIIIQTICSSNVIDDQHEQKRHENRQHSSFPSPFREEINAPACLSKSQLLNLLDRDRRASISRPYFHHRRPTRESARYSIKNSPAFSPRLGKRTTEDEVDRAENKFVSRSIDLDTFLVTLVGHLHGKQIDIVYEDSTKVCLSQSINDALIQQVLDKFDANRHDQTALEREETSGRQSAGKHPFLFRYRVGRSHLYSL